MSGYELQHNEAWAVVIQDHDEGWPGPTGGVFKHTISHTRSNAIKEFDSWWVVPGEYRRLRRRGLVLAKRVRIVPFDPAEEAADAWLTRAAENRELREALEGLDGEALAVYEAWLAGVEVDDYMQGRRDAIDRARAALSPEGATDAR